MNDKFKPINTYYKNCRFRSRHEARWAIYFDTLNMKWEYEVEGFELPPYKLDKEIFINNHRDEVKSDKEVLDGLTRLADLLEKQATKPMKFLPDFWLPDLDCWAEVKNSIRFQKKYLVEFEKIMRLINYSKKDCLLCSELSKPILLLRPSNIMGRINFFECSLCDDEVKNRNAIKKASSMRFEFGEPSL